MVMELYDWCLKVVGKSRYCDLTFDDSLEKAVSALTVELMRGSYEAKNRILVKNTN